jgi:alpha-galactosidase
MAWQFDRPERGEGVVQAFRRADSPDGSARFPLRGLEADAHYTVIDLDVDQPQRRSGQELMEEGLLIRIPHRPGAVVITYQKAGL